MALPLAWNESGRMNRASRGGAYMPTKKTTQEGLVIANGRIVRIFGHVTYGIELINA